MSLAILVPVSITMALIGLGAFFWALRNNQFDDPEGSAWRILIPRDPPDEQDTTSRGSEDTAPDAQRNADDQSAHDAHSHRAEFRAYY